jgi:hypothetical protein
MACAYGKRFLSTPTDELAAQSAPRGEQDHALEHKHVDLPINLAEF